MRQLRTNFKFDAPIYVKQGTEYCIVLRAHTIEPKVWISKMGEIDVGGLRVVSKQPFLGVDYLSHRTTELGRPVDSEDLKFTLNKAEFNTATGVI